MEGAPSASQVACQAGREKLRSRQLWGGTERVDRNLETGWLTTGHDPKAEGYLGIPIDVGGVPDASGCSGRWQVRPKRQSDLPCPSVKEAV